MNSTFGSSVQGRTMLFPCAAGVQVPQFGAEDSKIKIALGKKASSQNILPMALVSQDKNPVNKKYVQMVSTGLSFAQDVVAERSLHTLPYSDKFFDGVFLPGGLIPPTPKVSKAIGRHDKRGTDVRHMPCYLKKIIKPSPLTPLRKEVKEKALQLHMKALEEKWQSQITEQDEESKSTTPTAFFMTEVDSQADKEPQVMKSSKGKSTPTQLKKSKETIGTPLIDDKSEKIDGSISFRLKDSKKSKSTVVTGAVNDGVDDIKQKKGDWDDFLMSRLSKLTANWIVHERLTESAQKEKLTDVLESWYGRPTHTDLVREQISDGEEEKKDEEKKPKGKWKKKEALLERVYNKTPSPPEALDPYSDDNKAPFYRQPAGIRRKKRSEEKEEAVGPQHFTGSDTTGAINATAYNVQVRSYQETPPPTLKDFMNPAVGDKIYDTDNQYQQEWLKGSKQVYDINGDHTEIVMETANKYKKNFQRQMPKKPEKWLKDEQPDAKPAIATNLPERGHKRWTDLPQPVDDTAGIVNALSSEFDPLFTKPADQKQRRKVKHNHALVTIVHDWRSKWFLSGQFADSTPKDLIRDMADIQPHVRLKAIGTVAKASEYKPPPDNSVLLDPTEYDPVKELPEEIFTALEFLLGDPHEQVRKAAAITLYSMDRPNDKAKKQLRTMLDSESSVDRWAAAQCMALFGEGDSDVVAEIIRQILASEQAIKHEQGISLLAKISNSSTLVHCMVAEQLNSSSWRHRVIACKILPTLFGTINRDITQKLSELMWHDWHTEVRSAAAQCLGKTSHGRDVHDDIRDRIMNGTERTRMEAITKLGQLGIMTAKLLPAFLECFADPYVSIRCEVCITCGNLMIKDEQVLDRLVHLASFDPIWKVKALAIQALGKIGELNEDIKECILWAMRYEEKDGVRAEACHSIVALNIQDDDVIEALQDRLLVESSQIVREEMIEALCIFGLSTSEDMDMVATIKSEVRKLCTRNIIASQIILNETDEIRRAQLKRMVCQTEQDIQALNEKKQVILQRIRSQAKSEESLCSSPQPRTSTPMSKMIKKDSSSSSPDLVSREGTGFTPSSERELEAIMNQEYEESVPGSAKTSDKSRPTTEVSESLDGEEEETATQKQVILDSKIILTKAEDEEEAENDQVTEVDGQQPAAESEKDEESDKQASSIHQLNLPVPSHRASRLGLPSPGGSRLSLGRFSDRRSILSRDSLREREKLNIEVNAIYSQFNARYASMIQDLVKIDKGLNTKGSSADSSIIATPSVGSRANTTTGNLQKVTEILQENIETSAEQMEESKPQEAATVPKNVSRGKEVAANYIVNLEPRTDAEQGQHEEKFTETQGDCNEAEWKSFADTLSHDPDTSGNTSTAYPSYDENDDNNAPLSVVSTAGFTAQASEYEEDSVNHSQDITDDDTTCVETRNGEVA